MSETCKFCGQHPYEYIDVIRGAAKLEIVCCDAALLEAFNRGETVIDGLHEVVGMVAAPANGWVSVYGPLPEPGKTVLLSIEYVTPKEDADGNWTEECGTVVELGELTGDYFQAYASHGTHEFISHWMSLPEPAPVMQQEALL